MVPKTDLPQSSHSVLLVLLFMQNNSLELRAAFYCSFVLPNKVKPEYSSGVTVI